MNGASMDIATFQAFHIRDYGRPAKGCFRSVCGIRSAVIGNDEFHNGNLEWIAVRSARRLKAIAGAAQIPLAQVKIIEAVHEKFLNRERLAHVFRHLRNSPRPSEDDCTITCNCKKIRFRIALRSDCAALSQEAHP